MNQLEALMFDLDGTLIHSELVNARAYQQSLLDFGVEVELSNVIAAIVGGHWSQFLPVLARDRLSFEQLRGVAERKKEIYRSLVSDVEVNIPLIGLINGSSPELSIALVTSASRDAVSAIIPALGLSRQFDCIITGDDVLARKPDPEPFCVAGKRLGVDPSRVLVFEDSDVGVASARAYGAMVMRVEGFGLRC